MNRNRTEIKEEFANRFIMRSMMAYPSDKAILPLIFHLNTSKIDDESKIQQYNDQIIKCSLCGSFFNPYCQINDSSVNWKCSICNTINQLPLPPSDSIYTAYSLAKKYVCYNNAIFDFIPPHTPIRNHQKPKIIISIQGSIYNNIKSVLCQLPNENDLFSYGLTIFDSSLQLFNFHSKTWHIISDFGDDNNFFFPTNQEFLFGSFSDTQQIFLSNYDFTSNNQCNIDKVCKFVSNFQNVKLLLILSGPLESVPPTINYPVTIIYYKNISPTPAIENFFQWSNNPSTSFFVINNIDSGYSNNSQQTILQNNSLKLTYILSKSLFYPFKSNITIRLRTPKLFEIKNQNDDSKIFTVFRLQKSVAQILSFAQFEISFNDCMNDGLSTIRYINVRMPLSPDPRIFRSATFPNPLQHLCIAAYYIFGQIREIFLIEKETIFLKIKNKIMDIAFQFPLMNFFWPHFIHELTNSDILKNSMDPNERNLIFLTLKNLPPQITLLHFLPLQYCDGNLIPLYPKANKEAIARVNENEILIISGNNSQEIASNILKLLKIDEYILPVIEVMAFEETKDEESLFDQWKHDFELASYKYLEEKRSKRK